MDLGEIGLLANPDSTRMKKGIGALRRAAQAHAGLHYRELSDIDDVPHILRDFADAGVKLLIIAGGDGTIQSVGTNLVVDRPFEVLPVLATLPGGHTNMTAESLGFAGAPDMLLEDVVAAAVNDSVETVPLPFLSMRISPDKPPVLGIFFGAATIVRGMQFTRRVIYPLGLPNALSHFLAIGYLLFNAAWPFKTARSPMRREPVTVKFGDTASVSRPYFVLFVTTLDRLILGIHTSSPVGEGMLRYSSIDYKASAIFRAVRTFLFGRPTAKLVKGLVRRRASMIEITSDCPVTLDGEFFDPQPGQPIRLEATEPFRFVHLRDED
ncbi:MAG: diacylglycerol kinase family protein [Alphaproteobacteria bacterium]